MAACRIDAMSVQKQACMQIGWDKHPAIQDMPGMCSLTTLHSPTERLLIHVSGHISSVLLPSSPSSPAGSPGGDPDLYKKKGAAKTSALAGRVLSLVFSQIFLKSFSLTFLAEWGDRSQIATIGWVGGPRGMLEAGNKFKYHQ
jgi:putative Ca2+/H+ antiporter (TMEM165/GDT1 family)